MRHKDVLRSKLARPSLRARARPVKQRTAIGQIFSAVNQPVSLAMQCCERCGHVQYPSADLCGACLCPDLTFRSVSGRGILLAKTELHHSLWEYFKRRIKERPWPIGSVQLDAGPTVMAHMGSEDLVPGSKVQVFSHLDATLSAVLITVRDEVNLDRSERLAIVRRLGLNNSSDKEGGF